MQVQRIVTTVNMHSCDYLFSASGAVNVECTTAGDALTFEAANCKVSIPEQTLTGITETNITTAGNPQIISSTNVTGIHGTASGCPSGNGAFTTGNTGIAAVLRGTTTMKGINVT